MTWNPASAFDEPVAPFQREVKLGYQRPPLLNRADAVPKVVRAAIPWGEGGRRSVFPAVQWREIDDDVDPAIWHPGDPYLRRPRRDLANPAFDSIWKQAANER